MKTLLKRFAFDEGGQDLAEYALLAAFVGLAGLAVWVVIQNAVAGRYVEMDTAEQDLWQPPEP
jgi:Flp pilus assembly pilin Flp